MFCRHRHDPSTILKELRCLKRSICQPLLDSCHPSARRPVTTATNSSLKIPPPIRLRSRGAYLLASPSTIRSPALLAALYPLASTRCYLPSPRVLAASLHPYSTMASTDSSAPNGEQKPMLARNRPEAPDAPSGQAPARGAYFPLGYKEGFSQWWAGLAPAVTEHKVLSFVPHLRSPPTHLQTGSAPPSASNSTMEVHKSEDREAEPVRTNSLQDPYGPRQWHSKLVQLGGRQRALNEFSVERTGETVENNLVMLHGYGAGLGFFYKNFEALSRAAGWKLYALDMLGMGRSSRPPFRIHAKEKEAKVREAESWFVDALEEWRVKRGIDKMTLLGHSLGGYMAVCYALKYPGHLDKLILASPVGIPEDPYAVNEALPEPDESTMVNEVTQDASTTNQTPPKAPPPPRKSYPKWLTTLWDANISPFSIVRLAGPVGPRLVSGWTSRRFSHLPTEEAQALHDYSYSLFRQRGSGEYALAYVLAPGAFARSPLIRRVQGVGRQMLAPHNSPTLDNAAASTPPQQQRETGIPVVLMYGEHDWMSIDGGHAAAKKMREEGEKALANASAQEARRENGSVKVVMIPKAGHHVYLDGWEFFNKEILGEMKDVEERQKKLKAFEK